MQCRIRASSPGTLADCLLLCSLLAFGFQRRDRDDFCKEMHFQGSHDDKVIWPHP